MRPDILFLAHRAPWPPDRGDRIRSWHMVDALMKLGDVTVAALADSEDEAETARAKLAPLCKRLLIEVRHTSRVATMARAVLTGQPASVQMFGNNRLHAWLANGFNWGSLTHIVGFSSQMGQYIPPCDRFSGRVVMDFVDVDSAKFAAYAAEDRRQPMRWVHAREARLLAAYEAALARRVDASLFVSEAEAALFRSRNGIAPDTVHALENGIDTARFDPAGNFAPLPGDAYGSGPLYVFTGQMDYRPNIEAVSEFALKTLPLVQETRRDAQFAIVGRAPTAEVRALAARRGVIVTGEVADTRPWLTAATAVVAPLSVARGVQNKLLEAMAMVRPVVASPAAAQGIDAASGTHLMVADGAPATARALLELIGEPARALAMGRAARARMIERYDWAARLAPLAYHLGLEQ